MMTHFHTPPLKRHPSLQPLSRDHYVGLVQGRRLPVAAGGNDVDRRAAVAAFLDTWDAEIAEHFDDEERLIAPLASDAGRARMHDEHAQLRLKVQEARQRRRQIDPGAAWLSELGEALTNHIRWEERELFPAIEAAAAERLDLLQPQMEKIEAARPRGHGKQDQ